MDGDVRTFPSPTEVSMSPQQPLPPQNAPQGPRLRIDDLIGGVMVMSPGQEVIVGRAGDFRVGEEDLSPVSYTHLTLPTTPYV